jgi:hypothetical protein
MADGVLTVLGLTLHPGERHTADDGRHSRDAGDILSLPVAKLTLLSSWSYGWARTY